MASGVPANTVPTEESLRLEDERAFLWKLPFGEFRKWSVR